MAESPKRIIVTGATGMLGKDVVRELSLKSSFDVISLVRKYSPSIRGKLVIADLESADSITEVMREVTPDCIVNCAALTDLERCERDRDTAHRINAEAVQKLISCKYGECRFIQISTDSVFAGNAGSYSEASLPGPLNYYAESKLLGERAAAMAGNSALIIRTNLYGYHVPRGKSLVEWALDNFSRGQEISGFDDVFFNPLFTAQLAGLIRQLISLQEVSGIIHVGTAEHVSKYEFLKQLAEIFGYDAGLVARSSSSKVSFSAKRPLNTTLDCSRLQQLTGYIPSLIEGMRLLKTEYKADF